MEHSSFGVGEAEAEASVKAQAQSPDVGKGQKLKQDLQSSAEFRIECLMAANQQSKNSGSISM